MLWVFYFECKMTQWWESGFWYQRDLGLNLTFSIDHSVTEDQEKAPLWESFRHLFNHFYSLLIKKKVKPILSLTPILFPRDDEEGNYAQVFDGSIPGFKFCKKLMNTIS